MYIHNGDLEHRSKFGPVPIFFICKKIINFIERISGQDCHTLFMVKCSRQFVRLLNICLLPFCLLPVCLLPVCLLPVCLMPVWSSVYCLFACFLSVCPSVYCLFACFLSVCPSVYCLSVCYLSVYCLLACCLSVCYLSVYCLFAFCLSVCPSVCCLSTCYPPPAWVAVCLLWSPSVLMWIILTVQLPALFYPHTLLKRAKSAILL
jgi:hypothetical protein